MWKTVFFILLYMNNKTDFFCFCFQQKHHHSIEKAFIDVQTKT